MFCEKEVRLEMAGAQRSGTCQQACETEAEEVGFVLDAVGLGCKFEI